MPYLKLNSVCVRAGDGGVPTSCFQKINMTLFATFPSILEESLLWSP